MHGAAHALHHAAPRPAPSRPAVNVDVSAPSVAPSAHANRAGASGEVDVVDHGSHAAGGVAASECLAANLGGGVVAAGGTDAHIIANDDAQSDDDDDNQTSVFDVIIGRQVGQREDTACNEDGVDISVGVDDDAVLGFGVHGQGVNLGVSLGVGIVVGSPPLASLDSWGARLISGILMTEITIYPLAEVLPLIHTLYYFLLLLLFNDNDNDVDDGNFDGTRRNPRRFIQGHTFSRP